MSQALTKKNLTPASLRGRQSAHSVLLRMASEEERAARVRGLKQSRPDLTWRRIAEVVGVSERSAIDWQKTGGIDYANAKKLAKIFEVKLEWLWSGVEPHAQNAKKPAASSEADRLQRVEDKLDSIIERLDALDADAIERDELTAALLAALRDEGSGGSGRGRKRSGS